MKLFLRVWNLKLPRLVISIDGGIANFELQPKLKRVLQKGLFRAAKTTGAWIITNGCQQGGLFDWLLNTNEFCSRCC